VRELDADVRDAAAVDRIVDDFLLPSLSDEANAAYRLGARVELILDVLERGSHWWPGTLLKVRVGYLPVEHVGIVREAECLSRLMAVGSCDELDSEVTVSRVHVPPPLELRRPPSRTPPGDHPPAAGSRGRLQESPGGVSSAPARSRAPLPEPSPPSRGRLGKARDRVPEPGRRRRRRRR